MSRAAQVEALYRARPRQRLLRVSLGLLGSLVLVTWVTGDLEVSELWHAGRWSNVGNFLRDEALPRPLREGEGWLALGPWIGEILFERGIAATLATFGISVTAIVLAAGTGALLAPLAARTLAARDPYLGLDKGTAPWRRVATAAVRSALVLARAVPEYALAFVLLSLFGPSVWPAILALAIHNAGILGRLGTEVLENVERAPLRALRATGATRLQITLNALLPAALGRYVLYVFYRFEACVRESTVLGMLGIVSLGYWMQESRAAGRYDELLVYVALGAVLVLLAEIGSHVSRRELRGR